MNARIGSYPELVKSIPYLQTLLVDPVAYYPPVKLTMCVVTLAWCLLGLGSGLIRGKK
jgi:hypothetical protein